MKNLLSLVTRTVAKAFHAFAQGRLRAEMSDPEFAVKRDSTYAAVEDKLKPNRQRRLRESQAAPFRWAEFSDSDLPTIGVL